MNNITSPDMQTAVVNAEEIKDMQNSHQERPKVSVVLCNCDNALFMQKSISSVLSQGIRNLELVCVDDASTDESMDILRAVAGIESRVKLIALPERSGAHAARKKGVAAARGEVVMFLDSRDFLSPGACETALNELGKGYDLIRFNVSLLPPAYVSGNTAAGWAKICNGAKAGERKGLAIGEFLLRTSGNYRKILFYAMSGSLAQAAFASMPDSCPDSDADNVEIAALAVHASALLKIPGNLYNYRVFNELDERRKDGKPDSGADDCRPICKDGTGAELRRQSLVSAINAWVAGASPEETTATFNALAARYGIMPLVQALWEQYRERWEIIGDIMSHYQISPRCREPKTIGLYYGQLRYGGTERIVLDLADLLVGRGYKVKLFLWSSRERDMEVNPEVKIIYAPRRAADARYSDSLRSLCKGALEENIDVMIFQDPWSAEILWESIPLRYYGIPAFMIHHFDFILPLLYPSSNYNLQANAAAFRCLDKLICLSPQSELYFRSRGVNAQYIHNPLREAKNPPKPMTGRKYQIVAMGRMDAPIKRFAQCLYVMREVVKRLPDAVMVLVGNFAKSEELGKFNDLARKLGISGNIIFTGWTDRPWEYLEESAIMLSTSYGEGFPMAIGEAQASGLPCVMYDLPIAAAIDNESIIMVPQGDYGTAAREIADLLLNNARWSSLSEIAVKKSAAYSPASYVSQFEDLLKNYDKKSRITYYSPQIYQSVMRSLAFYGAHLPPWAGR